MTTRYSKITQLGTTTAIANGDLLHVVVSPTSTPVNKVTTFGNLLSQLVARGSLANTQQANAQLQINAFSQVEVSGQANLVAGQSNDVLRFANGVGIVLTTDGGANLTISTANNTQNQKIKFANSGTVVGQPRGTLNITKSGNTENIFITFADNIDNDRFDIDFRVPDKGINDLTDVQVRGGAVNNALLFLNGDTGRWDGTDFTSIDRVLPCSTQYVITYDVDANTVNLDSLGATDTPTVYVISGTTIAFNIPQTPAISVRVTDNLNANITENIKHVSANGTYTLGQTQANSGTLYWQIPPSTSGTYKYVVRAKSGTVTKTGSIIVKDITSL